MAKTNNKKGETPSNVKESPVNSKEAPAQPANVLLGTISYSDDAAYEGFLKKMDVNQAVFVLVAAANYSQSRGAFSLTEGGLVDAAIRTIKKSAAPVNQAPEKASSKR